MNILANKTITDVPGILAAGIASGIKRDGKKDLCVVYSEGKASAAATFTTNNVKAAPVIINMENIKNDNTQAVVINSGNANSCTGEEGLKNALKIAELTAERLKLLPGEVLVASTGAVGKQLPMDVIIPGVKKACKELSNSGGLAAAEAILTTDTCTKTVAVEFEIQGKKITMAGMAKGSTMIHPNMGTLISLVVTDASISKELLCKAQKSSVEQSFNMVSIDGDTSTNDMSIVLANGYAGNEKIEKEGEEYNLFLETLNFVNTELAKMIAKDGEGATKLIEAEVNNAKSLLEARICAKAIISSNILKCATFGSIEDWPIVACTIGYCGIDTGSNNFDIFIGNNNSQVQVAKNAMSINYDKNIIKQIFLGDYIKILVNIKNGESSAVAWGCDLTYEYVKGNAQIN